MDYSRKVSYRAGLFNPKNLSTPEEIESALAEFGAVLNRENYGAVLAGLFDKQYITALVLSGISDEIGLNDWIIDNFPSEPNLFVDSFAHGLLAELSGFFLFYSSYSADKETASFLRSHHHTVQLAPEVIRILLTMTFLDENRPKSDIGRSAFSVTKNAKAKVSQNERRKAKRAAQEASSVDKAPFVGLNLVVPTRAVEAKELSRQLLVILQNILVVFLGGIRLVEVVEFIKSMFVAPECANELPVVTEPPQNIDEPVPPVATRDEDQVPHFVPNIQSMKVAFYFDSPDDFGKWRILLASQAQTDLREYQRADKGTYDIILIKMKELSNGFYSSDNQRRLTGSSTDVPILEAKVSDPKDLRIVYAIDCVTDYDNSSEVQALRIFGIFTPERIDHSLWKAVSRFLGSYGEEYHRRCVSRLPHPDKENIFLPCSFQYPVEVSDLLDKPIDHLLNLPSGNANQLHHVISLQKYVMLSKALLESIDTNRDAKFPFEVTKHERDIIQYPLSCYVLGRSGTGKTITMLFKMLLIERAYQASDRSQSSPKQMFVTKSDVLLGKVEKHFKTYLSSLSFASHVTGNSSSEQKPIKQRGDIPKKFSELNGDDFPLFVTFDKLCEMIEADIPDVRPGDCSMRAISTNDTAPLTKHRQLVDFDRFVAEYWPHFSLSLTNHCDALLVWNEIMGVISGSEGTLGFSEGYLDRQTYLKLSSRTYHALPERDILYDIFLAYLKRKKELQDFDVASRTHVIIRSLVKGLGKLDMQKISHLYVDETQDNLLIDTFLLRLLCKDANGLFWAGDTAQTISPGSSFRFNDLKAFQYRIRKTLDKQMLNVRYKEPQMFYLSVNYRSHAGIVNCAHSIIDVIKTFWQGSIDSLPRERGNAYGTKPIFYTDINPEFVRGCHFLYHDSNNIATNIELGAFQCILVRNDKAKDQLTEQVGLDISKHIYTLYDAKGLEFNDVILYNFFLDSPADGAAWRLVLHEVFHEENGSKPSKAPRYNHKRHAILCAELKGLYVAVTRARNNLRIVDESLKGEPMRVLWESRDQVISCKPGEELTVFANPSGEDEWAKQAQCLFDNQKWYKAFLYFKRARKTQDAAVADAYYQREQAKQMPTKSKALAKAGAFSSAAKAFISCANDTSNVIDKRKYFKIAAECYEGGGKRLLAAQLYRQEGWVVEAASLFCELREWENVLAMVTQSLAEPDMVFAIPDSILNKTRLHYIQKKEYEKAGQLFRPPDELLSYLEDRHMERERVDLLLHSGKITIEGAIEILLSKGQPHNAIVLLLDHNESNFVTKAKCIIFQNLWRLVSLGVTVIDHEKVTKLLSTSDTITLDVDEQEEIRMFRAVINKQRAQLVQLASSFMNRNKLDAALLCFDSYFDQIPELMEQDIGKITHDLRQFSEYVSLLEDLAFLEDPVNDPRVYKLFGIQPGEIEGTIELLGGSLLHHHLFSMTRPTTATENKPVLCNEEFVQVFHQCLQYRLLDRVTRENDVCRNMPALRPPCLEDVLFPDRDHSSCKLWHVSDRAWFEDWIGAHLLQISIYQSISLIQFPSEMKSQRRFWLVKLYEALNPSCQVLGVASKVITFVRTAFPKALNAVLEWALVSSNPDLWPNHMFLTFAMQAADFELEFDRKDANTPGSELDFQTSVRPTYGLFNTLQEMLKNMNWSGTSSVNKGISFIHHVVSREIPINIHVFCTFIERLCALLIVCNRLRHFGSLHYVLLPHSWLKATLERLNVDDKDPHRCHFRQLFRPLASIISALHLSAVSDGLQLRRSQFRVGPEFDGLESQGGITQAVFIARLCRVLGLLGCNIHVKNFQNDILYTFTSIHRETTLELSPLYACYFNAKSFEGIRLATYESMRGGAFDDMVKVLHRSHLSHPLPKFMPVRNVVYSTHDELLFLLQENPISSSNDAIPNADSATIEYDARLEQEDDLEPKIDTDTTQLVGDHETDGQEPISGDIPEEIITQGDVSATCGDREEKAECITEGAYRGFPTVDSFKKNVINDDGPDVNFVPDAELPAILETVLKLLAEKKRWLKNHLTLILGDEQDEIRASLTDINKATKKLQKQMKSGSPLRDYEWDIVGLRRVVSELIQNAQSLSVQIPEDLEGRLDNVYEAFRQEETFPTRRGQGQSGKRPPLVIEDLEDLIQEAHEDVLEYD